MKGKAWTSAEINRLKIMKLDGLPHSVIAERLGRSVGSVRSQVRYLTLHDMTYTPARVNHTWNAAEIEQAQEMYDSGVPASVIAQKYGVSAVAVYMKLKPRKRK
ncbi:MAG: hypothetical protein IIZ73_06050 [Ruminococcus sp.]|nr:hypothetical protein [Ruminococcus sp.]